MADLVAMKGITKSFGGTHALKKVDFYLCKGEIRALMGENGAGKSTLMKILTGNLRKDSGEIFIDGKLESIISVSKATRLGIVMIHQELNIIPHMTVMENIWLKREPLDKFGLIDYDKMYKMTQDLLNKINIDLKPDDYPANYSVAYRQLVEIAKALSFNPKILVMDEPTSSLTIHETKLLFKVMLELKRLGTTIIYISHRMDEIQVICDSVTVLRDGELVGSGNLNEYSIADVVKMMIGKETRCIISKDPASSLEKPILELQNIKINEDIDDISLSLRPGEILGFAGLMGSGRTEIAEAIYGLRRPLAGKILLHGKEITFSDPKDALQQGIGLIPEDRKGTGVVLGIPCVYNITLSNLDSCIQNGLINNGEEIKAAEEYRERMNIKMPDIFQNVSSLSGGNQQKISISKVLFSNPRVMIFDEPTRGVDIHSKTEICNIIIEYAKQGCAVIFISSELQEVLSVSDRILALRHGKIVKEFHKKDFGYEQVLSVVMA